MSQQYSKVDFLKTLHQAWVEWESLLDRVGKPEMSHSGVAGEWSVKDIICHITWFEREMVGLLQARALIGSDLWNLSQGQRNRIIFEQNQDRSLEDVLAEARLVHQELSLTLQSLSDEDLNDPSRFDNMPADWSPGKLIAENTFEHYQAHSSAIQDWLNSALFPCGHLD